MNLLRSAPLLICALALFGCARVAQDIEPICIDAPIFAGMSCGQLFARRAELQEKLVFAGLRQDQIHDDDYTRTLGVPMLFGTIFEGNDEEKIGLLKGETIVLDAEISRTGCGGAPR